MQQHVKLKTKHISLIIIQYNICHSFACAWKLLLKNIPFEKLRYYFYVLSVKGYCNFYGGDFGVCHVSNRSNSKNIRKIE